MCILKRKFSCVITNPPYNSERGNNNQSIDIYPVFVDKAFELSDRYVIMITKSNWMNFPSHRNFRKKMINGYNVDKKISRLDVFLMMFPPKQLTSIVNIYQSRTGRSEKKENN